MSDTTNSRELLTRLKDYADCSDASYAFLHWVYENEEDDWFDKFKDNPSPRWKFSDKISKGDKITGDNENKFSKDNNRQLGEPTAYALTIEARFNADMVIIKPKRTNEEEPRITTIDNEIQNFVDRDLKTKELSIFTHKPSPQTKQPYHSISLRTKSFVNRFELVNHIPNTSSGYSSSIFYDSIRENYCIAFRGTEMKFNDLVVADGLMALTGRALTQIASMKNLKDKMIKSILAHKQRLNSGNKDSYIYQDDESLKSLDIDTKDADLSVVVCGHSLGGHMAQMFCVTYPKEVKELYTYNAPGIYGGMWASLGVLALRLIYLTGKIIYKGARWLARALDKNGFIGNILNNAFDTIQNFFNSKSEEKTNLSYPQYTRNITNNPNSQYLANNNLSNNISKASKGSDLGLIIHHTESVRHHIEEDGSISTDAYKVYEPASSVISDLGFKLGLDASNKFDYKNTKILHLVSVLEASHFMTQTIHSLYLYDYIMANDKNFNKIEGNDDIINVLDYLNDYLQLISFKVNFYHLMLKAYDPDKLSENTQEEKKKKEDNKNDKPKDRLSILDSVLYPICLYLNALLDIKYNNTYDGTNEHTPNIEDLLSCTLFYKDEEKLLIDTIDKKDIQKLSSDKTISDLQSDNAQAIFTIYSAQFFVASDEILNKQETIKKLTYKSSLTNSINLKDNEESFKSWVEARIEVCKSIYKLRYKKWKYLSNDLKKYLLFANSNKFHNSKYALVIHFNEALHSQSAAELNEKALNTINVLRIELDEFVHRYVDDKDQKDSIDIFLTHESKIDIKQYEEDLEIKFNQFNTRVYLLSKLLSGAQEE